MAISQITAASIADGTVVAADIAANAVTTVKIADSAVTAAKLAPGAALSNGQLSITSSSISFVPDSPASASPYKILGQIVGVANTDSNVYVVPASTNTVVNLITVCNGTQNNILIDLVARPSTEALATKHFILKSLNIPAADTLVLDTGVTLPTSAILSANVIGANATSSAAGVAIHAYGVEIK
jgi:hypothetical protein